MSTFIIDKVLKLKFKKVLHEMDGRETYIIKFSFVILLIIR